MASLDQLIKTTLLLDGKQPEQVLKGLAYKANVLEKEIGDALAAGDKKKLEELGKEYRKNASEQERINKATFDYKKILDNLSTASLKDLRKAKREISLELDKMTRGTSEYIAKSKQLSLVDNELKKVNGSLSKTGNFIRNLAAATGITGGIYAVVSAFKSAFNVLKKYDEGLADIMKTTGLTKKESAELTKELLKIDTRTGTEGLMQLATAAGRLNITGKENIKSFVENADKVFVALNDSLSGNAEEIATNLGKIASAFNLEEKYGIGESISRVGSTINELGSTSKAAEGPIMDFVTRLQGISAASNIAYPDLAALGALFDENGQSMEVAATTFNTFLPAIGKDLAKFAKIAGMNVEDFKKVVEKDAFAALKLIATGAKSNQEGLLGLTETLESYGVESARSASIVTTLSDNVDRLTELQNTANTAFNENISLSEEFAKKNETLSSTTEKLGKAWDSFILSLESGDSVISEAIKGVLNLISTALKGIEDFGNNKFVKFFFSGDMKEFVKNANKDANDELLKQEADFIDSYNRYDVNGKADLIREFENYLNAELKLLNESNEKKDSKNIDYHKKNIASIRRRLDAVTKIESEAKVKADAEADKKTPTKLDTEAKTLTYLETLQKKLTAVNKQREQLVSSEGITDTNAFKTLTEDAEKLNAEIANIQEKLSLKDMNEELSVIAAAKIKFAELTIKDEDELAMTILEIKKEQYSGELHMAMKMNMKKQDLTDHEKIMIENSAKNERDVLNQIDALKEKMAEKKKKNVEDLEQKVQEIRKKYGLLDSAELEKLEIAQFVASEEAKILIAKEKEAIIAGIIKKYADQAAADKSASLQKQLDDYSKLASGIESIWSANNARITQGEDAQLEHAKAKNEQEKESLKQMLDSGAINQENYNKRLIALDKKLDNEEKKIKAAQAKRDAKLALFKQSIATAEAIAIAIVLAIKSSKNYVEAIVASIAAVASVIALMASATKYQQKAPQFAKGKNMPVVGADDGVTYNADFIGTAKTGLYTKPTLGLFAERGSEIVIDGATTRNIQMNYPEILSAIAHARTGVRQYAEGNNMPVASPSQPVVINNKDAELTNAVKVLNRLLASGIKADVSYKQFREVDDEYNSIIDSVSK